MLKKIIRIKQNKTKAYSLKHLTKISDGLADEASFCMLLGVINTSLLLQCEIKTWLLRGAFQMLRH